MATSKAKTVTEYLSDLPKDRAAILKKVRKVIKDNLGKGFQETMNWGMISYELPLKTYPDTYNKQPLSLAAIASQKNHLAIYLNCVANPAKEESLLKGYKKIGKKPDIGKSCIRFKSLDDIPLDVIGKIIKKTTVKNYIAHYEAFKK